MPKNPLTERSVILHSLHKVLVFGFCFTAIIIIFYSKRRNFHLTLILSQNEPFPAGDYMVTYVVHDQTTGQRFQIERQITIDDGASSVSSLLPTDDESTQTVPAEQSQQQQSPGEIPLRAWKTSFRITWSLYCFFYHSLCCGIFFTFCGCFFLYTTDSAINT